MRQLKHHTRSIKMRLLIAASFIGWSVAMVGVGSNIGDNAATAYAYEAIDSHALLTRLDTKHWVGDNLGKWAPYHPESGDLVARGHRYFSSADKSVGIGIWESKAGSMTYENQEYDELMYVLDGSIEITDGEGKLHSIGPGEGLILHKGSSGTFTVPEGGVRKIWMSYMAGEKG